MAYAGVHFTAEQTPSKPSSDGAGAKGVPDADDQQRPGVHLPKGALGIISAAPSDRTGRRPVLLASILLLSLGAFLGLRAGGTRDPRHGAGLLPG